MKKKPMFVITEDIDESSPVVVNNYPERKTIMKKQDPLIQETQLNKKVEVISEFQSDTGESDLEKEFN
jgi:hypothetical protein